VGPRAVLSVVESNKHNIYPLGGIRTHNQVYKFNIRPLWMTKLYTREESDESGYHGQCNLVLK